MSIQRLPQLLVNQIAAGEVVERPASVVKELVENSLDAGAARIELTVEEGGARLIRVSDDGRGIPEPELPLAVAPHATSKLSEAQQLEAIATLGFRGEALASIASVSRLKLTSRPTVEGRPAESGATIEVAGDEVTGPAPAAGSPGTVIEVRDLFFNTPARRKFLRTAQTEIGHIHDTIGRLAIAQPEVGFTVYHNNRKTLDLPAGRGWHQRAVDVLGKELGEALLPFQRDDTAERGLGRVWGLAGTPEIARSSGKFQHICLNGRPIRDRHLTHALREAYRGLMPPEKYPVAVVLLSLDPREADVNVHPTKTEVRFRRPNEVHGLVLAALRQELLGSDLTAHWSLKGGGGGSGQSTLPGASLQSSSEARERAGGSDASRTGIASGTGGAGSTLSTDDFVSYFKRMDPKQKGFVYEEVKRALDEENGQAHDPPGDAGSADDEHTGQALTSQSEAQAAADMLGSDGRAPQSPALKAQSVLQVHNSYVVTQDEEGLLIVDQHALHERVMFEQLRQRVLGQVGALQSQRLLMPAVVETSSEPQRVLDSLGQMLERIGIELAPFGNRQVAVQAFPTFLFDRNVEPAEFMRELIDRAENGEFNNAQNDPPALSSQSPREASDISNPTSDINLEAALHEVLDMMACKAAVKAGDQLSETELAELLKQREQVERSSSCPHGRPTSLRLTLKDLEKQFGRQ